MTRRRAAFTLVELLVVISIISMLMALLLPAVQKAREAGRRATCMNNIGQMAKALQNFEGARQEYPGYANTITVANGTPITVGWVLLLTPFIERNDLWEAYGPSNQSSTYVSPTIGLAVTVCPSNPVEAGAGPRFAYVANGGFCDWVFDNTSGGPRDRSENGIFHYRGRINDSSHPNAGNVAQGPSVNNSYISAHDGVSTTLLLAENMNAGSWVDSLEVDVCFLWTDTYSVAQGRIVPDSTTPTEMAAYQINQDRQLGQRSSTYWRKDGNLPANHAQSVLQASHSRPSSNHPGAAMMAFCDAHVKLIKEDIRYQDFVQLMTPWGRNSCDPAQNYYNPTGKDHYGSNGGRLVIVDDSQL